MIIGFTGKAGCGKSSVANAVSHKIYSFAGKLKEVAFEMGWDGNKDDKGRRLLQDLGTIGREYKKSLWVDTIVDNIRRDANQEGHKKDYLIYSVDDLRYDNEAIAIREMGGIIIHLKHHTVQLGELDKHASEQGISEYLIDYSVPYDKLSDIIQKVRDIIAKEGEKIGQNRAG